MSCSICFFMYVYFFSGCGLEQPSNSRVKCQMANRTFLSVERASSGITRCRVRKSSQATATSSKMQDGLINKVNFGAAYLPGSLFNKTYKHLAWCRVGLRILQLAQSSALPSKKLRMRQSGQMDFATRNADQKQKNIYKIKCNAVSNAVFCFFWPAVLSAGA